MSYRIDGKTPYWGGLEVPCKEREYPDAWDWVFKEMTQTLEESRKACKEWDELANKLREKLEQMEKKVSKMTKAEAFEYLKGKKIKCICAVAYEDAQANKVERFLKDVGCKYHFANHISWRDWYWPLYGFIVDKKGEIYVAFENQMDFFVQDFNEEISADDILSIEIVEECAKDDEDPYFGGRIKDLQEMIEDEEVLIITKTNYLTMTK